VSQTARSMRETATACGIGLSTLYKHIAANKGPVITKVGNRSVVLIQDCDAWLLSQREASMKGGN
jgi:predicted DNA-binding transcriptional regulator AlpA